MNNFLILKYVRKYYYSILIINEIFDRWKKFSILNIINLVILRHSDNLILFKIKKDIIFNIFIFIND